MIVSQSLILFVSIFLIGLSLTPMSNQAFASPSDDYTGIGVGDSSLVRMLPNGTLKNIDIALTTGFYFATTEISNNGEEPKSITLITMILDGSNVAQEILFGDFTIEPNQSLSAGEGFFLWIPQSAGDYTVKNFVWSSLDNDPEPVLQNPNILSINVNPKIISLGEGERDNGLLVKRIDVERRSLIVSHEICAPTGGEREQVLHEGEFSPISTYARAYLVGLDSENRAIFEFEGTGRGLCAVICHHTTSAEVYLEHYKGA